MHDKLHRSSPLASYKSRATYLSNAAKISLISITAHQEQRRKLIKNINLKRKLLTAPPRQRRQNLIEGLPTHKNTEFQKYKIQVHGTQCYRNSKWLCES